MISLRFFKNYFILLLLTLSYSLSAQKNIKQLMKENEIEKSDQNHVSDRFIQLEKDNKKNDLDSYRRSNAWQRTANATIFYNPKDLDISIIGGRVRSTLVDKDNNIALVAPSGGGLWTFNPEDGTPFSPVDDFADFMAVTHITQDPNNAQHIIIGTGDDHHDVTGSGLFESIDGGVSFSQINSTDPSLNSDFEFIRYVKFAPGSSFIIYIATKTKIYRSKDSGVSWEEVYASTNSNYNKIRSLDFTEGTGVMIAVGYQGIYSSSTGDASSFTSLSNGIPAVIDQSVLATFAGNRDIAYVFAAEASENSIYKTIDGGTNWTKLATPDFSISQAYFCLTIGIHPTNSDIVIAGSVTWGYSTDGASSWTTGADLEVDFHDVHFHESDEDVAFIGYDQGLGRVDFANYEDVGLWVSQNGNWEYVTISQPGQVELGKTAGFNTSQIYYGDYFPESYGDAFIQGQQDGGSFASVNGYEERILVGDGGACFINKQDPTIAYASTQSGNIKTTKKADVPDYYDFVENKLFYGDHPNWITQFAGNNADGTQMYIASNTTIQRSLDTANNFTSIATQAYNATIVAVENKVDPVVYAIGYDPSNGNAQLIRIDNAATTATTTYFSDVWEYGTYGFAKSISIDPNDVNTIYIGTSYGNALKVSGTNTATPIIQDISGDISDVTITKVIAVKDEQDLLIAGTNIGLFYSQDNGVSWILSEEIPHTKVSDLKLRESDNRLFVFTYGRGAWATTVSSTVITGDNNAISAGFLSISPNPAINELNIKSSKGDIRIYDVNGIKVYEQKGTKKCHVSSLKSGVYIVHLLIDNTLVSTEKIVVE